MIWPGAAGLGESDPDGSVCEQRAGEVGANVVVEGGQTSVTSVERRVPVSGLFVSVNHVARRVVYHAALASPTRLCTRTIRITRNHIVIWEEAASPLLCIAPPIPLKLNPYNPKRLENVCTSKLSDRRFPTHSWRCGCRCCWAAFFAAVTLISLRGIFTIRVLGNFLISP